MDFNSIQLEDILFLTYRTQKAIPKKSCPILRWFPTEPRVNKEDELGVMWINPFHPINRELLVYPILVVLIWVDGAIMKLCLDWVRLPSQYDPSLFISYAQGHTTILLVYVDDILITGSNQSFLHTCITKRLWHNSKPSRVIPRKCSFRKVLSCFSFECSFSRQPAEASLKSTYSLDTFMPSLPPVSLSPCCCSFS